METQSPTAETVARERAQGVAYHEAAHAVCAVVQGLRIKSCFVKDGEGEVDFEERAWWTKLGARGTAALLMAGAVGSLVGSNFPGAPLASDTATLARLVRRRDEAQLRLCGIAMALALLDPHWGAVARVADLIVANGTVTHDDVVWEIVANGGVTPDDVVAALAEQKPGGQKG